MYKQLQKRFSKVKPLNDKFAVVMQTLFLAMVCIAFSSITMPAHGQDALGFSRIAEGGFWDDAEHQVYDPHNSYTWSMRWFKGKLYVGTNRDILVLRYLQGYHGGRSLPEMDPFPVNLPEPLSPLWHDYNDNGEFDSGEGLDTRAEIWRYTPETEEWEMVYQAPWEPMGGQDYVGREYGYRNMLVFTEQSGTEALYATSSIITTATGVGPVILRTETGDPGDWQVVSDWSGTLSVSLRGLVSFKGKLYTAPVGEESFNAIIYESTENPELDEPWRPINPYGFDDPENNKFIFEMCAFNGYLYAATLNPIEGLEIWKTAAEDYDPVQKTYTDWVKVVDEGAYRGPLNETALSMFAFTNKDGEEHLYVGLGIQGGGRDIGPIDPDTGEPEWDVGPATAELIRIDKDDNWELIFGEERENPADPENPIVPISGLGAGLGDIFTGYIWRIEEYKDWLYIGSMDSAAFVQYVTDLPPELIDWLDKTGPMAPDREAGIEFIIENTGGFDLWKSEDGVNWYPITWTGFHNYRNIGVRAFEAVEAEVDGEFEGLFLGTANLFTDDEIPNGGCQVWLGTEGTLNPPTNLQANFESHQVKLRWTPSPEAIQYRIIRHTGTKVTDRRGKEVVIYSLPDGDQWPPPESIGITSEHFFVDNTVEEGKPYTYYVKADSGSGISDPSNPRAGVAKDIFFSVIPGKLTFNRSTRMFVQTLTIINNTPMPLKPNVPIVLEGLTPNVILENQDGRGENGSPYVYAPAIPGYGGSANVVLRFKNPTFARIKYVPFVVFGPKATP